MIGMRFDINRYKELSGALDDSDVDYDAFRDQPIDPDALRCLRYMHDVESHTICYLRDLLATPAHADPEITTFLSIWAYEELWHSEAIGKVLVAHGELGGTARIAAAGTRRGLRERIGPVAAMVSSSLTKHGAAVHMTWGALNEWTTQAGYSRLIQRTEHPELANLLRRIMKQEGRHIDFYASQARDRLAASPRAQRLTRFMLERFWRPVGSGVMPKPEVEHLIGYLFGGPDGAETTDRIERRLQALPGLDGVDVVNRARLALAA